MNKKVRKLIIPAAGWGTRFLPMTKVVHKELLPILDTPLISLLVDEAIEAGIEEIILIISERKKDIANYFAVNKELETELESKNKLSLLKKVKSTNKEGLIKIVIQHSQNGLGHALACAKNVIKDEPFAIILGDDLIKSKVPAIKQLIEFYYKTGSNILGVQSVSDSDIPKYGIVAPIDENEKSANFFKIKGAVEKPKLSEAPSNKAILGRYVFNSEILDILSKIEYDGSNEIQVVDAFEKLQNEYKQDIYAFVFEGTRYDLGSVKGFVQANIDYALDNIELKDELTEFINEKLSE